MTRLVLLHGFTQTGASWNAIRRQLPGFDIVAPDLAGHGDATDGRRDLWGAAADVRRTAGAGVYVGYSFGARVALHCALVAPPNAGVEATFGAGPRAATEPGHPTGLVLISGTAGIEDPVERAARRDADEALAERIRLLGVEAFLDEWLAQPLFAGLDDETADRPSRLSNSADGLADSLRYCGTGTQSPLWDRLGEIDVPVLVVAGEHDAKFRSLAGRLADGIAGATLAVVDGCGHSVPFEAPGATADLVRGWVADNGL